MASGPITSWQIQREKVELVTDFLFFGSRITVDGDFSHEIRRHLLLVRKAVINLYGVLKSRDYSANKGLYSLCCFFFFFQWLHTVVESWTVKKVECQRIDTFELYGAGDYSSESLEKRGDQTNQS